jgi:hypothetical protein
LATGFLSPDHKREEHTPIRLLEHSLTLLLVEQPSAELEAGRPFASGLAHRLEGVAERRNM